MRNFVPAFLLISAVLCLAPEAHAITLQEVWSNGGCKNAPTDEAKKVRCAESRYTYCRISANPSASECQSSDPNNNAPIETPSGPSWNTAPIMNAGSLQRARACINHGETVSKCCANDATACEEHLRSQSGKDSLAYLRKVGADAAGLKAYCNKSEEVNLNGSKATYAVAGACDGAQQVCNSQCAEIIPLLKKCIADAMKLGQPYDECSTALELAESTARTCKGKNSDAHVASAAAYGDGSKLAQICGNLAGDDKDGDGKPDNPSDPGAKDPGTPGNEKPPAKTDPGMQPASTASSMGPMLASMLPALMQMLNPQEQPMAEPILDRVDCSVNPNLAGCQGTAAPGTESWNEKGGMAEASVQATDTGTFNLPDGADGFTPQSAVPTGTPSNPPTVASVPNGGGGIPGGGGGGPASLGGGGGGGGGAQLGSKADVLHGLGSASGGAFGQQNAAMNMKSGESGGYSYGGGPSMDSGMNLGDFLPGGRQDPTKRALAGSAGQAPANYQIQAKDVNIWNRISERIKSRCSQGLLRDCVP